MHLHVVFTLTYIIVSYIIINVREFILKTYFVFIIIKTRNAMLSYFMY